VRSVRCGLLVSVLLVALHSGAAQAATREQLTADRVYYVRTDGSNTNDCLSDTAAGACKTWPRAVALATALDFGGRVVTIQHGAESGPKTFTEAIQIGPQTGGGVLVLAGSSTPGGTVLSVAGTDAIDVENSISTVAVRNLTINGAGSGAIQAAYKSTVQIENGVVFGPSVWSHIYMHDRQALIQILNVTYTIAGSAPFHIFNNGGWVFHEASNIILSGTPSFTSAFIAAANGGGVQAVQMTYSGSAHGVRYSAQGNGAINTYGSPLTMFPGDAAGLLATGGQYQ
jgi:hypothetical protein